MEYLQQIDETAAFLRGEFSAPPEVAIVLGSGLGGLAERLENAIAVPYAAIPHFPRSTVEGHAGMLLCGELAGRRALCMSGRFHYYEGYTMREVTFPVRAMRRWGIERLVLSNASGGVNPSFSPGDVMLITDHINLMPNPLVGPNLEAMGPRFPSMGDAYCPEWRELVLRLAEREGIPLTQGCYVGTTGPSFETPREYHFFRTIGGDAVGMSTVPEVIVARHCGMRILAFSVIANVGGLHCQNEVSHQDVQAVGQVAGQRLARLIEMVLPHLD